MEECERCEANNARYYELAGSVYAYLCTVCRTNYHTHMTSIAPITEFWEKQVAMKHAIQDPLLFASANADFLEIEWQMHQIGLKWLRGKDES